VSRLLLVAASGLAREAIEALPAARGTTLHGVPVIGPVEEVVHHRDRDVVVCAGHGRMRRDLVARLRDLGVSSDRYATVVHPRAWVAASCVVGPGSIVLAHATLTSDVRVGRHVVVMPSATLTHDVLVDDHATLCAGVSLGGSVRVGCTAYLGMNAAVRQGVTVGAGATLGAGGVLLEDLPDGETWVGVPAAPIHRHQLQGV
jgi:sugar O-acyltransferase (sialic acid O-acetyltransferase NeuD family)